jgi:hypothetical protein
MNFRSRTYVDWLAALAAATTVGLLGCTGDGTAASSTSGGVTDGDFVSDDPSGASGQDKTTAGDSAGTASSSGAGGGTGTPTATSGGDAARAIAEADIIQVKDGRLYALSQYAGLTVIDISVKDHLTVLGRRALKGIPFEMYLRGSTVYAMFSSWGQYTYDAATKSSKWVQSSHVEALDVTNPATIGTLGSFDLPGDISDSRVVGDVLYAVSYENGYCWGCSNNNPQTTVTSIAVGNPALIHKVDQLGFSEADPYGYGWRRSISVTPQRMYVAGIQWNGSSDGHSTIQVVDIADPGGHLVLGASVAAKGQITSRWQMDEHDGVLRVVSQPGVWRSTSVPAVQTFTVASSQSVQPLGYMDMTLPKPESLRSVRFDGARAFAVTAEQKDPLFTIDLSDPAHPRQVGSIEIPGWIYHMEPRGDRLLALGFDNGNPEGALTVSLFDVADLASPTLLKRVAFGGTWSSVAEDQDRIHKAFTILPDEGLILVPYSGWRQVTGSACGGTYESGIQLVDYSDATLTKRGVALSHGQAKRAFLHDDRLFAVADDDVRTFDITNRSAPAKTAALPLATKVDQAVVVSDKVVRLSSDWWTNAAKLEVASAAAPGSASVIGSLDLSSLANPTAPGAEGCYWYGLYSTKMLAHGTAVYLVFPTNDWQKSRVVVISIADPAHPVIAGQITVNSPFYANGVYAGYAGYGGGGGVDYYYYGGYGYGETVAPGEGMVQAGSTLVFRRPDVSAPNTTGVTLYKEWLEVIDLSNPTHPTHAATVELPAALGHTPLRIDGTTVLTSHWSPLAPNSSKVRFYLDRVSVASPSSPVLMPQVNVPGSLVTFDADAGRLLTVDYKRLPAEMLTPEACAKKYGYGAHFEPVDPKNYDYTKPGYCKPIQRSWKLLDVTGSHASLLDTRAFTDDKNNISSVFVGDDRVFAFAQPYYYGYGEGDGTGTGGSADAYTTKLEVLGGLAGGHLAGATVSQSGFASSHPVAVAGKRLVLSSYSPPSIDVLDATNLSSLTLKRQAETGSYLQSIVVQGDDALCSLGPYGLEVVDLSH